MGPFWIACFVSGVAGLSYELTYVRYLGHLFGATTPAVAATVAVFFAGTALGSGLGARWLSRRGRPLLAYAGIETGIGLVGLVQPSLMDLAQRALADQEGTQSIAELVGLSALLLLLPTVLLGATFPAMVAVIRRHTGATHGTATLYALNTMGAVAGCLLVSLWWLPTFGLRQTSMVLGGINLALAAAMVGLHTRGGVKPMVSEASSPDDNDDNWTSTSPAALSPRRAIGLALVSGFIAIAVEVQWVRALALSFPATVYVFALVLAAYLVGIGAGSSVISRVFKHRSPRPRTLLVGYVLAGLGCLLALNLLPQVGPWSLERLSSGSIETFNGYLAWVGGISMLCMLPATVAMGATLPLLVGLATGKDSDATTVAGRIYGANTFGGVVGSLAGAFWLMPTLGLSRSLALLALAYLALALVIPAPADLTRARRALAGLVGFGVLIAAADLQPEVNALRDPPNTELLFYRDAPSGTVAVYEHEDGARSLRINNQYTLSNTTPGTVAMQYRLGLVPMALHPAPRKALLVGFATGTTLAAMAATPEVEQLDCVEIHDIVFALAPYFGEANRNVSTHPAVRLVEGDGRRYIARKGPRYDVVVEDLFVPRNPGVGALYSLEHFTAVRQRLADDGVFVVWLPLWQLGPGQLDSIVATFLEVFPQGEAWMPEHSAQRPVLGLVAGATHSAVEVDLRVVDPSKAPHRAERARRVRTAEQLRTMSAGAPVNTLDYPFVEMTAPAAIMGAKLRGRAVLDETKDHLGPL